MMKRRTRAWCARSVAALAAAPALAPAQQPRPLANPTELSAEFSSVRGLAALPNGKLVVTDAREKRIALLNPATGAVTSLGRSGQGPKEFQAVGIVQRDKGGGVVVYDPQQKRFLPIAPDGSVRDVRTIPNVPRAMTIVMGDGPDAYTADTVGNIYTVEGGLPSSAQRSTRSVIREGRNGKQTVAELRRPESRRIEAGAGITMTQSVTYSPRDLWAVAPDGWVAVIRASPYQVEWYPPTGAAVKGAVIPAPTIPVTEEDRRTVREEQKRTMSGSSGPRAMINGQSIRPSLPDPVFASTKPAVTGRVALIDEQGRLWVERSQPAGAATSLVDVIDRTGAVVHRVVLPDGARVVGFDRSSLYAVRTDADDVLHLLRFPLP